MPLDDIWITDPNNVVYKEAVDRGGQVHLRACAGPFVLTGNNTRFAFWRFYMPMGVGKVIVAIGGPGGHNNFAVRVSCFPTNNFLSSQKFGDDGQGVGNNNLAVEFDEKLLVTPYIDVQWNDNRDADSQERERFIAFYAVGQGSTP